MNILQIYPIPIPMPIYGGGGTNPNILAATLIALNFLLIVSCIICWIRGNRLGFSFIESVWSDEVVLFPPAIFLVFIDGFALFVCFVIWIYNTFFNS